MRIVIFLEGGKVQSVVTDQEAEVLVVDNDIDGVTEDDIKQVNGEDAYCYHSPAESIDNSLLVAQCYQEAGM
jgi:hypothetical protein